MFIPLIIFIAGAALGSPVSVSESVTIVEPAPKTESLDAYVKEYFADAPILADIAWCESTMRHTLKDGSVIVGEVDADDIGIMQINTRYHLEDSKELGLDIYSLNGNLEYAKHLYEKQGTKPWKASRACWDKVAVR